MNKEKLLQLQVAFFFNDNEERPDKLMSKIDDALEGIFDQIPSTLPIPSDAPPEIPRVMAKSSNGLYECNVGKSRIDFTANYGISSNSISVDLENFIYLIRPFISIIFGLKDIIRFGFVGHYFYSSNNPGKLIQSKYFKNDFGQLDELNIRYNKKSFVNGIELNDVISLSVGEESHIGKSSNSGVVIQRDINNVPIDALNIEDVMQIITQSQDKYRQSGIADLIK